MISRSPPVVIQLFDAGPGMVPSVYVNSKPTSWNTLADDLKNELKLRPRWVVYVEADRNLPWADAVNVVAVAKGLHAKVFLLTLEPTPPSRDGRPSKSTR